MQFDAHVFTSFNHSLASLITPRLHKSRPYSSQKGINKVDFSSCGVRLLMDCICIMCVQYKYLGQLGRYRKSEECVLFRRVRR